MSDVDHEPTGPFIGAAFLCEQILKDDSGITSVIRIIDRVTQSTQGPDVSPDVMPPFPFAVKGYVMLKDGEARGRGRISFRIEEPSGLRHDLGEKRISFSGGGHGSAVMLDLNLELTTEGLYWIDVLLEDRLLTRIPLEVVYDPTRTAGPAPSSAE